MFDGIFYVINQLAQAVWSGLLSVYDLRPIVAMLVFLVISWLLWTTRKSPGQNALGAIIAITAFIVVMPSGVSTGQEIIRQHGLEAKYDCLAQVAMDYKYWTGEKDSSLVCEK